MWRHPAAERHGPLPWAAIPSAPTWRNTRATVTTTWVASRWGILEPRVANRLIGILHGCLRTGTTYDEATAWPTPQQDQQEVA